MEWLYQLRLPAPWRIHPAEDLKLARSYADVYAKAKGPQAALVKQWVEVLEEKKR